MGERKRLGRGTGAAFLDYAIRAALSLLTFPFLLNTIGVESYGIYFFISAFSGYLGFLDLGITQAVTRHASAWLASGGRAEVDKTVSSAIIVQIGIGTMAASVCLIASMLLPPALAFSPAQRHLTQVLLQFLGVSMLFGFAQGILRGLLTGAQLFGLVSLAGIVDTVAKTAAIAAIVVGGGNVIDLTFYTLVAAQASPLLIAIFVRCVGATASISVRNFDRSRLRDTLRLGGALTYISFLAVLLNQTDGLVLGVLASAYGLALFAVAQKFISLFRQIDNLLPITAIPAAAAYGQRGEQARLRSLVLEGSFYSNAMLAPAAVVVAIMAGPLVIFWLGISVADAVPLVQVYTLYFLTFSGENFVMNAIIALNRTRVVLPYVTILACLKIVLSVILTILYGPLGVVLATTVSYVALNPWFLSVTLPHLNLRPREFVRAVYARVWPPTAIMGTGLFAAQSLFPASSLLVAAFYCVAALVAYAALVFFVFINAEQRRNLQSFLASFRKGH